MKLTVGNGLGHITRSVNHGNKIVIADPGAQSRKRELTDEIR